MPAFGQVMAEYAVIIGGIAVVCLVALLLLGRPIDELFREPAERVPPAQPFTPPATPGPVSEPTSVDDCEDGGWQTYGFATQAECEQYVVDHAGP